MSKGVGSGLSIQFSGGGGTALALALANNVKLQSFSSVIAFSSLLIPLLLGCSWVPHKSQRDRLHNPFPQLKQVAILPFFNQSSEPTLDTKIVTQQYYSALQAIPGFEVMPVGVSETLYLQYVTQYGEPQNGEDFQYLAQLMGVEALVVGSVTDYQAYYPPRLAMTVNWFAANEGFHPIPAGYGLPWGTEQEKQIPSRVVHDAEFELARSQLATQTPMLPNRQPANTADSKDLQQIGYQVEDGSKVAADGVISDLSADEEFHTDPWVGVPVGAPLPADWPDSADLIPDPPSPVRPVGVPSHEPVLTHTKIYQGDDPYFTNRLANHIETGDDARPGGWQGYLRRSDDFIRFCCHLHITEMLESRGGTDQRDLILRWPLSRY